MYQLYMKVVGEEIYGIQRAQARNGKTRWRGLGWAEAQNQARARTDSRDLLLVNQGKGKLNQDPEIVNNSDRD